MEKQAETTFIPMRAEICHTEQETHTIGVRLPDGINGRRRLMIDFSFLGTEQQCIDEAARRSSFAVTYEAFELADLENPF